MANNTAKIIAALGASALGFQKGQQLNEQAASLREEREYKRQERERENQYRSQQMQLGQSMAQELEAAGDDEHAKRLVLMRGYEKRGQLDAQFGKASIADIETLRKTTQGMKDEGNLQAYMTYMQTGDARQAGEIFNKYGKNKINLDSLQAVEEVEPVTGQKVQIIRGKTEDGKDFAFNPYAEARKYGGLAGMQAELKAKAEKQEKIDGEDRGHKRQLEVVEAQGKNQRTVAQIAAANGAGNLAIEREKLDIAKRKDAERRELNKALLDAQRTGDKTAEANAVRALRAFDGKYENNTAKAEVRADRDGNVTIVSPDGTVDYKPSGSNEAVRVYTPGQPTGGGKPAGKSASASSAGGKPAQLPPGMKQWIGNTPDGRPVFLGNDGKQYAGG